ncbi:hypothetical protein [Bradyrhizobium sp. USDA 3315]
MHDRSPSPTRLTDTERLNRLRLIRSDNVGPRGIMAQTPQGNHSLRQPIGHCANGSHGKNSAEAARAADLLPQV